jgi:hypothetical protein
LCRHKNLLKSARPCKAICGPHKKLGTLFFAEITAVRGNSFSLRDVALTLSTKNQFLSLLEWVLVRITRVVTLEEKKTLMIMKTR